jgi:ATP-binding cassette subfamily F protein 3
MALLSAFNLGKYFGAQDVFAGLSFEVHAEECIALIGANGCGKSTLLEILAGELEPDSGRVQKARDIRIGYMPQAPDFELASASGKDVTLWDAMLAVFRDLQAQRAKLRQLEARMASDDEAEREAAIARYGALMHRFEQAGGFTYETRIAQVLGGLGFSEDMFTRQIATFSGGERTRALLARLLLEEPDLLLLDEPTNHLDLDGIEWLEDQLKAWKGAIIVVAHDRAFLDAIAGRVWELVFGNLAFYTGNYTAYVVQREERRARQLAAYEAQQEHIAKTEDYIQRYMAGQRSAQAKGRLKRLEREERLERPRELGVIHPNLQTTLRSGDLVLGLYDMQVGYSEQQPLVAVDEVEIRRGQCVALVGPNGSGKTTLLRTILGERDPLTGQVRIGAGVRMGYFAQVQAHLAPELTVLDTLLDAGMVSIGETRSFLARYGFKGEDVFKNIAVLSGGERARVALAILALRKANFLLLDEPTNHLDLPSQEVMQAVFNDFAGTILLVSHDRYLIREIATHVWTLTHQAEAEDNVILSAAEGSNGPQPARILYAFKGYATYAEWHQAQRDRTSSSDAMKARRAAEHEAKRQARRARERALARQQRRLETLEEEIHTLEARMQELTTALNIAGRVQDIGKVTKLGKEYEQVESRLDRLLEEWTRVAEEPVADVSVDSTLERSNVGAMERSL